MKPIQIISQDLFEKVRSRFQNLEMGDETGAVTIDPAEAIFFDFDFIIEGNNLGRVSISLGDLGCLKVYYSQGITENHDDPIKHEWFKFLKEMRFFAMRRLLRFDTRDIAKTNLDKKDFQHLAQTQGPKEEPEMTTMNESRWNNKSSKKTSRATSGKTEVIIRHKNDFQETYAGARSQPKHIKSIFIQNSDGERFKYPFIHTAGAFAMAQHVDHGGVPHDPAGKAIIKMSEQIAQLGEFQRKVRTATLHDDATGISERAIGRLNELKAQVAALGKRHHYENWINEFHGGIDDDDTVLDDVTMEQYKQKFTQTSFQEELTQYFPLIHKIMSEADTVELEDFVGESEQETDEVFDIGMGQASHGRNGPEDEFEDWADATEGGELTPDQIETLKQALSQLPDGKLQLGNEGQTAIEFFADLVELHPDLAEKFKEQSGINPEADPITDVLTPWAEENYPNLVTALGLTNNTQPQQPAPEQPVAEGPEFGAYYAEQLAQKVFDENPNLPTNGRGDEYFDAAWPHMVADLGKKAASYKLNYDEDFPSDTISAYSWLQKNHGGQPTAENEEAGGMPNKTMPTREAVVKEVAKLVKSRFNESNPEVGPFNGAPNIALDVKKKCAEMFGDEVGDQAEQLALEFMEKLSKRWEEKHGAIEDDGLARLKELLNNVKAKVEGIGDVTQDGHAPGNNIMGAEEGIGSKILGGAAIIAALWGVNNHMANQAYEASPQLQKLTQFYQQAEAHHDVAKMKELERRIEDHKARLDLGYGDVMGKDGKPKEIVPEMADILKLSGLAK